jgi:hypothetical protein
VSSSDDGLTATTGTVEDRTTAATTTAEREPSEDVRGPCDEAEHANDPRCTGAGAAQQDDDRGAIEDRDDRSGPNRGHGGDDDRSGSNRGSDDDGGGHSGSGRSGNDD